MKKLRILDLYVISLIVFGLSAIILRTHALLNSFNSVTMHFDNKTAITIAGVLVAICVVGFCTYFIFGEKSEKLITKVNNAASFIPAGIVSTALLFMGVDRFNAFSKNPAGVLRTLSLVCGILAFLSIASFFISLFIEKNDDIYKAAFSLSIVLFLALYATQLFYNKSVHPTNSPNKIVDQMAYLFSAAFFLFESRIPLGRAKWRGYVSFGLIATLLNAYSAIPSLIVYLTNGYVVSDSIIESVLTLTLMLFIGSKVLQTKTLTVDAECEEAKSIVTLAKMREEEIEEHRKLSHAQESNIKEEKDDTEDASNYTFDIPYVEVNTEFNPEDADLDLKR